MLLNRLIMLIDKIIWICKLLFLGLLCKIGLLIACKWVGIALMLNISAIRTAASWALRLVEGQLKHRVHVEVRRNATGWTKSRVTIGAVPILMLLPFKLLLVLGCKIVVHE